MDPVAVSTFHLWLTFAVILAAIIAYALDRWAIEIVSGAILAFLVLAFEFHPLPPLAAQGTNPGSPGLRGIELLEGFANPALISILCLLIIGRGLNQTGALELPTRQVMAIGLSHPRRLLASMFILAGAISAVMNNTPVVVMFIPIIAGIAAKLKRAPSQVMMPLSYLCVLGGMTTVIGSSTNLIAVEAAFERTGEEIGFFAFTEFGLILASVGALYTLFVAPRLLPYKESLGDDAPLSGKHYLAEVTVHPGHPLDGAAAVAGMFKGLSGATVRLVIQNGKTILPPFDGVSLSPGDKIIVAATRKRLFELLKELPGLFGTVGPDPGGARREERLLSEAVVAPGSRLAGRPIREISNELGEGHFIIGIERRSRMRRGEIADIRLEVGDVLLVLADRTWVQALRANRDILLLEWASEEVPDFDRARLSQVIFLGTVGAAILGVNIAAASLVGALLMVATGCLNVRQAARVIDRRIVLLITAALAMGAALEATGGAHLLASGLVSALSPFGPGVVLSAFFLLVAILTNVLSNNATAAIFAPIAITTAQQLGGPGADVTPFVFGMIFAANCSFATPFAYQTNLLVMGPGQYKFMDFVKAGVPLIVLLWLTFSLLAPLYYDLG